jgi:hypothetical protein
MMDHVFSQIGAFLIMVIITECIIYYGSLRFMAYLSKRDDHDSTNDSSK